jgi:hypothetical protein
MHSQHDCPVLMTSTPPRSINGHQLVFNVAVPVFLGMAACHHSDVTVEAQLKDA